MAAPLKPWERAGVNSRAFVGDVGTVVPTHVNGAGSSSGTVGTGSGPPPLPPRIPGPGTNSNSYTPGNVYSPSRPGYSSYSNPYSFNTTGSYGGFGGFGGSGFGGYSGGYSGYNSYGSYGRTGFGPNTENRFIAAAEESSQPAFQSLESIVQAFGSVSMMLDSTLNAVYSSFRAVLGVADQFTRLGKVLSALTIFRTAKWAYYRLLHLIGLSRNNPNNLDALFNKELLSASGVLTEADIKKNRSSWPITLFMAILVSAPYFIWRIISSLDTQPEINDIKWAAGEGEHFIAQCDYDFSASNEQELSFKAGQTLRLAPRSLQPRIKGWILAATDKQHVGLVPANYIRIMSKQDSRTSN